MDRFEMYTLPAFNRTIGGASATLVVFTGFLAAVWNQDPALTSLTLQAMYKVAFAILPWVFLTILDAFAGQAWLPSERWKRNYRQTMAAFLILVLGSWIAGVAQWFWGVSNLLAAG